MKVLFAASEATPFIKTGGLADVSGALPQALKKTGVDVIVFLPFYNKLLKDDLPGLKQTSIVVNAPPGSAAVRREGRVYEGASGNVKFYFIREDGYFDREGLYGDARGDYADNLARFAFFSAAVIEAAKALDFKPDVIHCNDWQTGLIPAYLNDLYKADPFFSSTATLFTIHNLAFHGFGSLDEYPATGLDKSFLSPDGLEFYGRVSQLKSGITYSDAITTVSKTYSQEIRTESLGFGLEGLLRHRESKLFGILNGVDTGHWNPAKDKLIAANYSSKNMSGKKKCRAALLKEFGLAAGDQTPVVGVVSRLTDQKGWELVMAAEKELMAFDFSLALVGTGDKEMERYFSALAARFPGRVSTRIAYDERLAHAIEAGSDIFLMPSRYEPCGLNQIYSLLYGTAPIVRATGGLNDTVRDLSEPDANGFKFKEFSSSALVAKLAEAVSLFKSDRDAWLKLSTASMDQDFSWAVPAREYAELYATL